MTLRYVSWVRGCRGFESHLSSSFSFSMEKELFRLVVLPCFDLRRSSSSHVHGRILYSEITYILLNVDYRFLEPRLREGVHIPRGELHRKCVGES